jgi:DNA-binding MarR family transcriptional regulator
MTTALDRLERAGYVRRVWNQQDRRAVRVEITGKARQHIDELYGPLARAGATRLRTYTAAELAAALRYLEDGRQLQRAHAKRIRALPPGMPRKPGRDRAVPPA